MKFCLSLVFLLFSFNLFAQQITISGKIRDEQGKPIPFASIYIKNTTKGTSANSEGEYSLNLQPGNYEVLFKAVGYGQSSHRLQLNSSQVVNITLTAETYQLKGVTIGSGGEDPAYAIIRKAIKKRSSHLKEVKNYTCDVYIKGLQKLLAAPKRFMGRDINKIGREIGLDSNRRGIIYLSESESKYSFQAPDKSHEEMISSKVSGSNRAFSFNRVTDLGLDFYQNLEQMGELSNRPLISPLADDALFYYRYQWMGITIENGETVNKIKVTPRREHDPCFEGYIYILDDSWRIYSVNLMVTKKANINLVDTLRINQNFIPVTGGKWMLSSSRFDFTGGLLGFRLGGYFISVYKDYDLNPRFTKGEFNEKLRITPKVNKVDSAYWEKERPVPLTDEEKTDYKKKAVLAKKRESKQYLDSLDKANNDFKLSNLLLNGYNYRDRYKHEYIHFNSILGSFQFNTVQGFVVNYGMSYIRRLDSTQSGFSDLSGRYLQLSAKVGYGFSDKVITGSVNALIPLKNFSLSMAAGSDVIDLNNQSPISPTLNTFHSLLQRRNYEKLYHKQYASAGLGKRIVGGWQASLAAEWADRTALTNTNYFSLLRPKDRQYTANNPFTPTVDAPLFPENQSFKITFRSTYDFSNQYETYPNGRRYLPSPYPTVGFTFVKAISGVLGSDADFSRISFDITKRDISLGMYGRTSFYAEAGKFFDVRQIYYPDYKQFEGLEGTFYKPALDRFLLLDYYRFSAYTEYLEGHVEHNFSGLITNKIPGVRKLKLQEIVDVNYLSTPQLKNYTEVGAGLQYFNIRLMYGRSYNSGDNIHQAIRLGISL